MKANLKRSRSDGRHLIKTALPPPTRAMTSIYMVRSASKPVPQFGPAAPFSKWLYAICARPIPLLTGLSCAPS